MICILAEKPSQARNFAVALGGANGLYKGESYEIVASVGHIYALPTDITRVIPNTHKHDYYTSWNLDYIPWDENDFRFHVYLDKTKTDVLKKIKDVAESTACTEFCIATDDDPSGEGELLAWEVIDHLKLSRKVKISRMYFEDESVKQIQKAFENRKVIPSRNEDGDLIKAETRSHFDYLSMQVTRIATICARQGGYNGLLRQGRLKSVMTYLVGQQEDAWRNYEKKPYFEPRFRDENGNIYKVKEEDAERYEKKELCSLSKLHESSVTVDKVEQKSTQPGKLLDLAALSAILATKGYKPKDVLDVYQKMYTDGIVSYPRTEDTAVTIEQYNDLLPLTDKIADVVGVDKSLLTQRKPRKKHIGTGLSHGANRPGTKVPKSLSDLGKYGSSAALIYTILAKNWLSIMAEDYEYELQSGHVTDFPAFTGSASIPKKAGFKAVFDADNQKAEKSEDDEEESAKPLGKRAKPFVYEGKNKRPQKPTIKWLMGRLEKYNVGTGATRTSTIAEITAPAPKYNAQLMKESKGTLSLTASGVVSYILLNGCHFASPEVTEKLFNQMEDVGKFRLSPDKVIHQMQGVATHDKNVMMQNTKRIASEAKARKIELTTPSKEKASGTYAPEGKEVSFNREWASHRFTDDEVKELLLGHTITIVAKSPKTKKNFTCNGRLEEQEFTDKKTKKTIPYWGFKCLNFVETGQEKDKASGIYAPTGEQISFNREWSGHKFTDDEVSRLLAGEEIEFPAMSKKKKMYTAKGGLEEQEYKKHKFWGFKLNLD